MKGSAHESGQATLELLGALPVLLMLGLAVSQLLAVGYTAVLAGNAAEAGALAVAAHADAAASVRNALPASAHPRVHVRGGRISVRLRPPSLVPGLGRRLEVHSTASVAR